MKKKIAGILVVLMAAMTLAGCGGKRTVRVIDIELTNEEYAFGVDKT